MGFTVGFSIKLTRIDAWEQLEQPEKVKEHPVFKELVRYRTLLERVRCGLDVHVENHSVGEFADIFFYLLFALF